MSFLLVAQRALTVPGWVKNALWRAAKATPSLDLPFADSKSLIDAITGRQLISYARAGSGTYTDSDGVLRAATTNLLLRSEEFETTWTTTALQAFGSGSVANAIAAPNGSVTADLITENTATTSHRVSQDTISGTAALRTYTASVYFKSKERTRCYLNYTDNATGEVTATFNLSNQSSSITAGGSWTGSLASIQAVGNNWYRCSLTATKGNSSFALSLRVGIADNSSNISYTGDGTSGIYLWGAQLEQSSTVGEYIPTGSTINSAPRFDHRITSTTTNLAIRSEEFDNATWVQTGLNAFGSGSVANAIAAPDGTVTGDLIEEDTSTGFHRVSQTLISGTTNTGTYTASVYVKASQRSRAYISLDDNATGEVTAGFALLTQAFNITTAGSWSGSTASIEDVGNEWFRISLTSTKGDGSSALTLHVGIAQVSVTTISYPGNGTAGLYVWGAQLVASDSNGRYVRTAAAAASFSTTESLGLLVEEQRTNLMGNSGVLTATPNWTFAGTTLAASGAAPDGNSAYEVTENTATSAHSLNNGGTAGVSSTSITSGTIYTGSIFLKKSTDDWVQLTLGAGGFGTSLFINFNLATGSTGNSAGCTGTITPFRDGWYRCTITATATATALSNNLLVAFTNNTNTTSRLFSYTGSTARKVFAALGQFEAGATASSYIPTTTAAATRNADVVQITGTNFSSWYRQDEGTFFVDFNGTNIASGQFPRIFELNDGTQNNLIRVQQYGSNLVRASVNTATVGQFAADNGSVAVGVRGKTAFSSALNDAALVTNGTSPTVDATYLVPSGLTQLGIGNPAGGSTNVFNSTIRRLTYWPQRLPNATLQAITQP